MSNSEIQRRFGALNLQSEIANISASMKNEDTIQAAKTSQKVGVGYGENACDGGSKSPPPTPPRFVMIAHGLDGPMY